MPDDLGGVGSNHSVSDRGRSYTPAYLLGLMSDFTETKTIKLVQATMYSWYVSYWLNK